MEFWEGFGGFGIGLSDGFRFGKGDGGGDFLEFFEGGDGAVVVALSAREVAAAEIEGVGALGVLEEADGDVVARVESCDVDVGEGGVPADFEVEEGGFDGGEAIGAPHGVGDEADGVVLGLVLGLEGLDVAFEVGVVGRAVFLVDDHGGSGIAVFASVLGGDVFAFGGGGSGGVA